MFSLVTYMLWIQIFINMAEMRFVPLLKDGKREFVNPATLGLSEAFYVVCIILMLGPLRVFLKIKEGKTSLEKIKEEYEDGRNDLYKTRV